MINNQKSKHEIRINRFNKQNLEQKEKNMKKKLYLLIALLVALAVAGGSFAYTATSGTAPVTIDAIGVSGAFSNVTTTAPTFGNASGHNSPSWSPSASSAGSVTAGDIYYIDLGTYTGDILVTLYINNPTALAKMYSYINLAIVAYGTTSNNTAWASAPISQFKSGDYFTTYLGISTGYVSFILKNSDSTTEATSVHRYFAIAVGGGSYYCISTTASGSLEPQFFIDVKQA